MFRIVGVFVLFDLLFIYLIIKQFWAIESLKKHKDLLQKQLAHEVVKTNTVLAMYDTLKKALCENDEKLASAKH